MLHYYQIRATLEIKRRRFNTCQSIRQCGVFVSAVLLISNHSFPFPCVLGIHLDLAPNQSPWNPGVSGHPPTSQLSPLRWRPCAYGAPQALKVQSTSWHHPSGLQSLLSDHIQLRVLQMKLLSWLSSQLPPFIPNIETWTAQCPGHCQWRRSPVALFPLEPDASQLHSRWSRSRSLGGSAETFNTPGDVELWGMATERNGNES